MKRAKWAGALLAAMAISGAYGQQAEDPRTVRAPVEEPAIDEVEVEAAEEEKPWYLEGGVDFRSQYIFRGYTQNEHGYIAQPYAEFGHTVFDDGEGFSITPYIGTWNNLTEEQGPDDLEHWNEFDAFGGADFAFGDFNIRLLYTLYSSPANAFDDIHELGLVFSHPVGEIGPFESLNAAVGVYQELRDDNGTEDTYLELGLQPTLTELKAGELPVLLSLPIIVGASLDDYYLDADGDDEFLGYTQIGIRASIPLPLPARYGAWSIAGEIDYIHLFADGAADLNDGEEDEIVFVGNITYSF